MSILLPLRPGATAPCDDYSWEVSPKALPGARPRRCWFIAPIGTTRHDMHTSQRTPLRPVTRFHDCNGVKVYRIAGAALPSLSGHVHLLLGAGPPTLVDTGNGSPQSLAQILHGIDVVSREFGESVSLRDIRRILITHGHVDHIGGLAELARRTGAEVAVHPLDSRAVAAFDEHAIVSAKATQLFFRRAGTGPAMHQQANEFFGHVRGRSRSIPVAFPLHDG